MLGKIKHFPFFIQRDRNAAPHLRLATYDEQAL